MTLLIAVLTALPIAMCIASMHVPDTTRNLALASLALTIACAVIFRSWVVTGTVIGLCIGVLQLDIVLAILWMTVGFSVGSAIDPKRAELSPRERH